MRWIQRPWSTRTPKNKEENETPSDRAARRTATATVWIALFTLVLAALSLGTLWILKRQLKEMHDGGTDTHNLATAAGSQAIWTQNLAGASRTQADRTKDLADRMKDQADRTKELATEASVQAVAARDSADAAQRAADIANQALHLSERAYITTSLPQLDFGAKRLTFQIVNSGRIPSGTMIITVHEATVSIPNPQNPIYVAQEGHWRSAALSAIAPDRPIAVNNDVPLLQENALDNSQQMVFAAGTIEYSDGFSDDPQQLWNFCWYATSDKGNQKFLIDPCDPNTFIAKIKTWEEYPSHRQSDNTYHEARKPN